MHKNLFEDYSLSNKDSTIIKNLLCRKKIDKMWAYIDSLNVNVSKFKETEVICKHNGVVLRKWNH